LGFTSFVPLTGLAASIRRDTAKLSHCRTIVS
jgi:hypothetical protein